MKIILLALLLFSSLSYARRAEIAPFTSDGCSSWPEGTLTDKNLWRSCCFVHDISYWMGGTAAEREKADEGLRDCVGQKKDLLMGWIMFTGVRVGGSPGYNTPYRWGYGWNYSRSYRPLTKMEKKMVAEELDRNCVVEEDAKLIENFMRKNRLPMTYMKFRNY